MSAKFLLKVSAALVTFIVLIFLYFRNVRHANRIRKTAERIENDWNFAKQIAENTNRFIQDIHCEISTLSHKLERLIYEIDIQDHHLLKCHKHAENIYILITSYEHLNTANADSVEKLVQINYKFVIDRPNNKVAIFSDDGFTTTYDVRKVFIKGLFKKYFDVDVEW